MLDRDVERSPGRSGVANSPSASVVPSRTLRPGVRKQRRARSEPAKRPQAQKTRAATAWPLRSPK
jgi:hypothetical protein